MSLLTRVSTAVASAASADALTWYEAQLARVGEDPARHAGPAFVAARRKLGTGRVPLALPGLWHMDGAGRLGLLLAGLPQLAEAAQQELVQGLYLRGELEERRAVLRALPHLPNRHVHQALAIEACRTNSKDMFEAIACENDYPAVEFPTLAFHQMVLKALFMNVDAERILGLVPRIDGELLRMLTDFEAELQAAGRPVPSGMPWIRSHAPHD